MQKIDLLCIGGLRAPWAKEACSDYIVRLLSAFDLTITELPASKKKEPDAQREEESGKLSDALSKRRGSVWVLDERGKQLTSPQFSEKLEAAKDQGDPLIFLLGGAYGLTDAVRSRADHLLALSAMTLPHELCRVVFLEQLYRASQIAKGSGYHH